MSQTTRKERSLVNNIPGSGGAKNRGGWPLDLDNRDPEGIASFTLGLGYAEEDVVTTLISRCNLDSFTARRIVKDEAQKQQQRR